MKRIILMCLLFTGCLFQKDAPEIVLSVDNPPKDLIVSDTFDFSISLTNEGGAPALNVKLESNIPALLTFEQDEIDKIEKESTKQVKIILEAVDILKEKKESESIEAIIKAKYYDAQGDQRTAKTAFTFTVRKPKIMLEKVEAGLLPGKVTAKEKEKVPVSVSVKNLEDRKMENLYIAFCSEYGNLTVYRLDVEKVGTCFEYRIQDVLWYNDILVKGFTLEASLPPGAHKVAFVVQVKLLWRNEGYEVVLDVKELKVEITAE